MLLRTFYVSEIAPGCTDMDVQVILGQAQVRNRRLDVTGMLAKSDGHFCQVVEGRPDAVEQIMERVKRDARHARIRILLERACRRRLFEGWSMGLIVRDDMAAEMRQLHELGAVPGMSVDGVIAHLMPSQLPPRL